MPSDRPMNQSKVDLITFTGHRRINRALIRLITPRILIKSENRDIGAAHRNSTPPIKGNINNAFTGSPQNVGGSVDVISFV